MSLSPSNSKSPRDTRSRSPTKQLTDRVLSRGRTRLSVAPTIAPQGHPLPPSHFRPDRHRSGAASHSQSTSIGMLDRSPLLRKPHRRFQFPSSQVEKSYNLPSLQTPLHGPTEGREDALVSCRTTSVTDRRTQQHNTTPSPSIDGAWPMAAQTRGSPLIYVAPPYLTMSPKPVRAACMPR